MSARDLLLQRLHDGELPEAEAHELRDGLTDVEREKLAALADVDALIGGALSRTADEQPIDLWAGLESRLAAELPVEKPAALATTTATGQVVPLRRRTAVRVTATVVSLLAMAASVLLFVRPVPRPGNGCDVESLEVAGQSAAVMSIPDEGGQEMTLIWFDHQDSDEWESL